MAHWSYALRTLARSPLTTAAVVLSLGAGIGVNTVVFSWLQTLVLRPLPGVSDASRFHLLEPRTDAGIRPGTSWPEYRDLEAEVPSLRDLLAYRMVPLDVGVPPDLERTYGLLVSGNYFSALGLRPLRGRLIEENDAAVAGGTPVAVVSHDYWRTHLGADPDVIGRTLRVNELELTVIGVTPRGFQGTVLGLQFDLFVPATLAPVLLRGSRELDSRSVRGYYVMGALPREVPLVQAQAEAGAVMSRLARDFPETNGALTVEVLPFWRALRGPQALLLQGVAALQGIMLLLLLAVCANTATLMLARASTRGGETSVRVALGATRRQVAQLVLTETLVLGAAAAVLGALIAMWGTNALRAMPLMTTQFPVRFQTDLDLVTLAFAALLGVGSGALLGMVPAFQLARAGAGPGHGTRAPGRGGRLPRAMAAVQIALAVLVTVAAALFLRSFRDAEDRDPGFRAEGVLLAAYDRGRRDVGPDGARRFAGEVLARLRALPDVESAALAVSIPLDIHGLPSRSFELEGRPRLDGTADRALSNTVSSGYFDVLRIPLTAGRDFVPMEDTAAPAEAIVNEEFVRRFVQEGAALGRRLTVGGTRYVIVGIARTTLNESFTEPPTPVMYLSFRDRPAAFAEMHVRTRLPDESLLAPGVRRVVRELDASLPVYNVRTLRDHVEMSLATRRIPARMFMVLGPLIVLLTALGVYAVVAYNVAHRTAEIGIRMAVGARPAAVVSQILRENVPVIGSAAAVGWVSAAAVYTRLFRGELDVLAFGAAPALLVLLALIACFVPARRASGIDPVSALRVN